MNTKKADSFYKDRMNKSLWNRFRYNQFIKNFSPTDILEMENILLNKAKSIFKESVDKIHPKIKKVLLDNYDKRINTLPRKDLFELYSTYIKYEENNDDSSFFAFFFCMSQAYQIDNKWYPSKRR